MNTEFQSLAFVDYGKAFDSIQHTAVFEALQRNGVQEKYNILKETYRGDTAQMRTETLSRSPTGRHTITDYSHISDGRNIQEGEH